MYAGKSSRAHLAEDRELARQASGQFLGFKKAALALERFAGSGGTIDSGGELRQALAGIGQSSETLVSSYG